MRNREHEYATLVTCLFQTKVLEPSAKTSNRQVQNRDASQPVKLMVLSLV